MNTRKYNERLMSNLNFSMLITLTREYYYETETVLL